MLRDPWRDENYWPRELVFEPEQTVIDVIDAPEQMLLDPELHYFAEAA